MILRGFVLRLAAAGCAFAACGLPALAGGLHLYEIGTPGVGLAAAG